MVKKGKKMDLGSFLADASTGSWADEMEEFPSAPSGENSMQPGQLGGSHLSSRGPGGDRSGGFDRDGRDGYSDRPQRVEVPFPTAAPYTAFVGNLSFDFGESDLEMFFSGMPTTSIRLVIGQDGKPKGFGYVEFEKSDDLRNALSMSGTEVAGRAVRISVAEAPKNREGRADEEISWTRSGPLAPLAGRSGGFGGRDAGREGGFDRPRDAGFGGGERSDPEGARMGFGSKFVPSPVDSPRRGAGGFGGSSYDRAGAGGEGEDRGERAGFGSKFVAAPVVSERAPFGGDRGGDRRVSAPGEGRSDAESSWSRSGPLAPLPSTGGRNGGFGDRSASGGFGDRSASGGFGDRSSPAPEAPRQRLQLSARSNAPTASPTPSTPSSRPNPFGSAAAVDSSSQISKAEAKLAAQQAEISARTAPKEKREEREFVRKAVGDVREEEKKAVVEEKKVEVEEVVEVSELLGEVTI